MPISNIQAEADILTVQPERVREIEDVFIVVASLGYPSILCPPDGVISPSSPSLLLEPVTVMICFQRSKEIFIKWYF